MLTRRPLQSPWFLWLRRIKERESGCDYALRFVHSRDDMAHFTSSQVIRNPLVNCSKCSTDSSIWHKRKGSPTQAADYHDFNSRIKYSAASVGMFTCTDSPSNPESTQCIWSSEWAFARQWTSHTVTTKPNSSWVGFQWFSCTVFLWPQPWTEDAFVNKYPKKTFFLFISLYIWWW